MDRKIKYILDADILGCFDNFDHKILRQLLENRIKDKSLLRLINKWLKAGIVDGDSLEFSKKGSPQGNIISPLLGKERQGYICCKAPHDQERLC